MIKSFPNRKDSIILTAIDIINELGIQGLSTKELAAREGIAESALYRHYNSKDDIVLAVLGYFSEFDTAISNSVRSKNLNSKEAIKTYITAYVEYYENYPAITAILDLSEALMHEQNVNEKVKEIFANRFNFLVRVIHEGQKKREINDTFTPEELAVMIYGYYRAIITNWRITKYGFSLKEGVIRILEKLLGLV